MHHFPIIEMGGGGGGEGRGRINFSFELSKIVGTTRFSSIRYVLYVVYSLAPILDNFVLRLCEIFVRKKVCKYK